MKHATKPKPNDAYRAKWKVITCSSGRDLQNKLNELAHKDFDVIEILTSPHSSIGSTNLVQNGVPVISGISGHSYSNYEIIARKWYIPGVDDEPEVEDEIPF